MSAPERSVWHGTGVSVTDVSAQVRRLMHEHLKHEHGHATTWSLNLVVTPGPYTRVHRGLESLHHRFPARVVALHEHAVHRVDATVAVHCEATGDRRPGYCHEEIALSTDRGHLSRAANLVRPLLVGGLPTVVWEAGNDVRVAHALAPIADRVLVDSADFADAEAALGRAGRLLEVADVEDAAWRRLDRWRRRLALAADPPDARETALAADRLEVRHGEKADALGLLMAGWVAARLGWRELTLPEAPGGRRGGAVRPDGRAAEVVITHHDGPPEDRVIAVRLAAGEREIRLERPPGRRPPEGLADTLGRMADAAPGYQDALRALGAAPRTAGPGTLRAR